MSGDDTAQRAGVTLEPHEAWLPSEHPLHRPRHGRRQLTALICASVFFFVPVLALGLGVHPAVFENRRLASFPVLSAGWGFLTGLNAWANDHAPFRDTAVHTVDGISRGLFGESAQPHVKPPPAQAPFVVREDPQGSVKADQGEPQAPAVAGFPKVIEGKDGWLYYGLDVQGKCSPNRDLAEGINNLKRLRNAVEASGRRFILVVPPDKSTVVPQYLPRSYVGQGCSRPVTERFWSQITAEVGAIDLREDLADIARADGHPPYYKLDTHWTDRGAIIMVRRLAETIEPGISAAWTMEPKRTTEFTADLPTLLGRTGTNEVQLYSLAPDGQRDRTRQAETDLREPTELRSALGPGMITTPTAILCDSYTQAATRYLSATFTDVDAVLFSTLNSDPAAVLDMLVNQDVIVVEAVERNLTSGIASVTDPAVVNLISERLAAHPRR